MKIILICNNFGKNYDGIGAYAQKVYNALNKVASVNVITAFCKPTEKIKRIFALGMTIAVFKAFKNMLVNQYDKVIIEYPFVEWNPLFCISLIFLKLSSICSKTRIVVTIHEFKRSNILRKAVIVYLAFLADALLVTEKENLVLLQKINVNSLKINIPSNVDIVVDTTIEREKSFVYFGIVNKAKAFDEMIKAWDEFNSDCKYKLYCITSSNLENMESHKNIKYIHNAADNVISEIMGRCLFSILPIRPFVDEKNATFKTSCSAGCVTIGSFCDEYKNLSFIINIDNYQKEKFLYAFKECINMEENILKEKSLKAMEFGKIYSMQNNVNQYLRDR